MDAQLQTLSGGLMKRGHRVKVLTSDTPHLGFSSIKAQAEKVLIGDWY